MKSIFKFVLILFSLAMSLLLEPSALQPEYLSLSGTIAHPQQESCEIVANNIFNAEIRGVQEEGQSDYLGSSPVLIASILDNDFFNKNRTQLKGCFIHNLSTSKTKVHQIRAP